MRALYRRTHSNGSLSTAMTLAPDTGDCLISDPGRCAHARSGAVGRTPCLDLCPESAFARDGAPPMVALRDSGRDDEPAATMAGEGRRREGGGP